MEKVAGGIGAAIGLVLFVTFYYLRQLRKYEVIEENVDDIYEYLRYHPSFEVEGVIYSGGDYWVDVSFVYNPRTEALVYELVEDLEKEKGFKDKICLNVNYV